MGMYTELVLKVDLVDNLPSNVIETLSFLFNGGEYEPPYLPDHPFFSKERWKRIGSCSSYGHVPWSSSKYAEGHIFSRSDIRNYDGEIQSFLDWLAPYLCEGMYSCIGWVWYEEEQAPTLIFLEGGKVRIGGK